MLYDAHLHAGMFPDIGATVGCALNSSITPVPVGIYLQESQNTLKVLEKSFPSIPVFVGIHPWYMSEHPFDEELFNSLLTSPQVKGIGECGLDNKIDVPLDKQIELLEQHLEAAVKHDLPVNLHIRGYHGELIRVLKKYKGTLRGVVHNFTFSYEVAKNYLDLGMYLSVGSHIIKASQKMINVLNAVGVEHLVLETDADFLHTGEYAPDLLKKSYKSLGSILNLSADNIEHLVEVNIKNLLRI
ncbi:TatD DNase family protein [Succinivibrio dextrinosolvens]|uniref:TatD family hydrolase n=1 Tax=Succinivibrio dextrinosolvens TaxID=83771 RepID=UPI0008EACA0A|nr:TatD family hydrolase [Succinivibrio dextrinosolvens]SFS73869.1 TatD DNase family protein [Succinivibrio dextrinosolvens]